jgi:hypothetical protein
VFLAYLMRAIADHFADRDVTIVCESAPLNLCALLHTRDDRVTVWDYNIMRPPQVRQALWLSDTWWLVDSFSPAVMDCRTVLVTSPRGDVGNEFQKEISVVSRR